MTCIDMQLETLIISNAYLQLFPLCIRQLTEKTRVDLKQCHTEATNSFDLFIAKLNSSSAVKIIYDCFSVL